MPATACIYGSSARVDVRWSCGESDPHRAKNQQEALRLRDLQRHGLARRVEVGHVEGGTAPHSIHDLHAAGRRSVCGNPE